MPAGASLLTVTFSGLDRAVANDNMMGPVKAALERVFRQTAAEPGPEQIGASAISPGPIRTRAASGGGGAHFDELLAAEAAATPDDRLVEIEDAGVPAGCLVGVVRAASPAPPGP